MNITEAIKWIELDKQDKCDEIRSEVSGRTDAQVYEAVDMRTVRANHVILHAAKMHVRGARFLFDVEI